MKETASTNNINEKSEGLSLIRIALLTVAVSLVTFMEILDTTIVNVSISHIAGSLGSTVTQGTWTISMYALASAIVVPLTSWVSKTFGQIKVFISAIVLFIIMSILCGISSSMSELVVFRFLQGFVSGPMVPLSQSILLLSYPPNKRGMAMAFFAMTVVIAPILGPVLGGYLTDTFSWPWIFYINVPVGIIAVVILLALFKNKKDEVDKNTPIDYVGIALLFIGVGSLQLMLDNGNDYDWFNSKFIITTAVVAVVCIILLVIWELTDKHPAVDFKLFKNYNYTIGIICMCLGMFCFFGSVVVFPLWLQQIKGYTSLWSGFATAPIGFIPFFLFPFIGLFLNKLNLRLLVSIGFIIFAITMFWFGTFTLDTPFSSLMLPRIIQGAGLAFFFLPLNQISLSQIPKANLVAASSLFNFSRALTTSIATAIIVYMWQHWSIKNHAYLTEHVSSSNFGTKDYISNLSSIGVSKQAYYPYIEQIVTAQSVTIATEYIFNTMGVIFILLIGVIWLAKPPFNSSNK